jgi:ketosteroid isomerase-like protein
VSHENVELAKRLYAVLLRGELDALSEHMTEDVVGMDLNAPLDEPSVFHGRRALHDYLTRWTEIFEEFRPEVDEWIDAGDYVVAAVRWIGTAKGSGAEVEGKGADAHHFRDGKIDWWASGYPDKEAALRGVEEREREEAASRAASS